MLVWGSMIPLLSYLLQRWDPYLLTALRNALAVPVIWLMLYALERRQTLPVSVGWPRLLMLGASLMLHGFLYTVGIGLSNIITAAVISACSPLTAGLVAWVVFRQPPSPAERLAVVLAIAGGMVAVVDWTSGPVPRLALRGGELLILVASVSWAWYSMASQRWLAGVSQLRITGLTLAAGSSLMCVAYALLFVLGLAAAPPTVTQSDAGLLAFIVLGSVVGGLFLWNYGVSRLGVLVASMYTNLMPVVAIGIGIAMGTDARPGQLVGGVLVIIGVAQAQLRRAKR